MFNKFKSSLTGLLAALLKQDESSLTVLDQDKPGVVYKLDHHRIYDYELDMPEQVTGLIKIRTDENNRLLDFGDGNLELREYNAERARELGLDKRHSQQTDFGIRYEGEYINNGSFIIVQPIPGSGLKLTKPKKPLASIESLCSGSVEYDPQRIIDERKFRKEIGILGDIDHHRLFHYSLDNIDLTTKEKVLVTDENNRIINFRNGEYELRVYDPELAKKLCLSEHQINFGIRYLKEYITDTNVPVIVQAIPGSGAELIVPREPIVHIESLVSEPIDYDPATLFSQSEVERKLFAAGQEAYINRVDKIIHSEQARKIKQDIMADILKRENGNWQN